MQKPIDRRTLLATFASAALAACGGGDGDIQPSQQVNPPSPPPPPPPSRLVRLVNPDVAFKWSELATSAMLADTAAMPPGLSPMEQSRILAMAFLAGHDALNNIARLYQPFGCDDLYPQAQPAYAYEVAVCGVLAALLPLHATAFDRELQSSLAAGKIAHYGDEVELGQACAAQVLALRAADGSGDAQGPYTPGVAPGDYQPTPPVDAATFVHWGAVSPFAMSSGHQFRAPAPYRVDSAEYAADYDEVRLLGAAVGATRSAEQSEIARFWLESTPLSWQRIAVAQLRQRSDIYLWEVARRFALLQMAQADVYIASLESKYHYNFWRPITAIHAADTDGNAATAADRDWQPFDPVTPPVPEYPSAHAAAGAAGARIMLLNGALASSTSYLSSTGIAPREFSLDARGANLYRSIATEIGLSRIYIGYHFRLAVQNGWAQGDAVAQWVVDHALPLA